LFVVKGDGSTRRFFRRVDVVAAGNIEIPSVSEDGAVVMNLGPDKGWLVTLEGRPIRTPNGHILCVPSRHLAMAIALEWDSQISRIVYSQMPLLNLSVAAIDRVRQEKQEFIQKLARTIQYDSLCVRASEPVGLVRLQSKHWDPILNWLRSVHDIDLTVTDGLTTADHEESVQQKIVAVLQQQDEWVLACIDALCNISKSVIFALSVIAGRLTPSAAYEVCRLEENYQMRRYGQIDGIYGHGVDIEFAKLQIAAVKTFLNLIQN